MTTRRHSWQSTADPDTIFTLRPPNPDDGASIYELIQQSPPLDLNSCYAYLLQSLHLADTCVIATDTQGPAGYISGYIPPRQTHTLFIWQVAVAERARGHGLALRMLQHLLQRPACAHVNHLEATVSPDNTASDKLFRRLARELDCCCEVHEFLPASAFGAASQHEAEPLYRIGPFFLTATHHQETPHASEHL
ncbi:MAG TPA: diaminobutyrate acetyltransferase [Moraxellaceae bacterium]|nr:diaminobutyrate acetyltransferase [Moraxellaceae bacterium]